MNFKGGIKYQMGNHIFEYRFISFIMAIVVYAVLVMMSTINHNNYFYLSALIVCWTITLFSTYKYFWLLRERH